APQPGAAGLLRSDAWRDAPLLLQSLGVALEGTRLPRPVIEAIGVWGRMAGQTIWEAPSALAFVPALIHTSGAYFPAGGIAAVPQALAAAAAAAGVELRYSTRARAIRH